MPTSASRITVLLVDDHAIMREGLQSLLEQSGEFAVVGQAPGRRGGGTCGPRTIARCHPHGRHDAQN